MALKRGFQDLGFDEMCGSPVVIQREKTGRADISETRADASRLRGEGDVQSPVVPHAVDGPQSSSVADLQPPNVVHAMDPHALIGNNPHAADVLPWLDSHATMKDTSHASDDKITSSIGTEVTAEGKVTVRRADDVQVKGSCDHARRSVWDRLEPKIARGDMKQQSFAAIVGGVPEPELEFFPIKEECDKRVHIPMTLMKGMVKTYRTVLLGYFLGPRVPYHVVLRTVTKAWGKFGFIDAMVNMHGFFFFRFNDEGGCMHVIDSSPLLINGVPLFVTQWDPSKGLAKPVHTMCPLWVKLYNIPLVAFNREGISRIASAIGIPLRMDACTASTCDNLWGRTSFAKLLVNVWAKGELKREVEVVIPKLSGEGEDVVKVVVEYDWEPSQCSICKVFGHTDMVCGKRAVRSEIPIKERGKQNQGKDAEGFQMPNRRQWKPKLTKVLAESSNTKNGNLKTNGDSLVGVGTVKRVTNPKGKEVGVTNSEGTKTTQIKEGGYCTIHAGNTPGTKEGGVIGKEGSNMNKHKGTEIGKESKEGNNKVVQDQVPFLQSVVETFKKLERAKRGVPVATANTFDVLSSEESDDEYVEEVATGEKKLEEPGIVDNIAQ